MLYEVQIDTPSSVNVIFLDKYPHIRSTASYYGVLCTENRPIRHCFLNLYSPTAKKETTKSNPVKAAIMLMLSCRIRK